MKECTIREIRFKELSKLEDLLYEAIYQPDETNRIPRSVVELPEVRAYVEGFGQQAGDFCFVAEWQGQIVGAVWVRILAGAVKGFGNVDEETPEFAIALYKPYRGQGIGRRLMETMIEHLRRAGYLQTSLHVQKENRAVRLYQRAGFQVIREDEHGYLMLLELQR